MEEMAAAALQHCSSNAPLLIWCFHMFGFKKTAAFISGSHSNANSAGKQSRGLVTAEVSAESGNEVTKSKGS